MEWTADEVSAALNLAVESLDFAEQAFRDYRNYPSQDFQRERIAEAQKAKRVLRWLRRTQGGTR